MPASTIPGMSTAAAARAGVRPPELTDAQLERILAAAEEAHSASTRRAYTGAWEHFAAWADAQRHKPLPAAPATVAAYLTERADDGLSRATLAIARAAIGHAHKDAGRVDPTAHDVVRKVLRGLNRRISKGAPQKQATGLSAEGLAAIRTTAHRPRSGPSGRTESTEAAERRGAVDIAICSVMRDAMLRRSEAAALRWADVEFRSDGSGRVTVRRAKTDQEAEGRSFSLVVRRQRILRRSGPPAPIRPPASSDFARATPSRTESGLRRAPLDYRATTRDTRPGSA